jgi:acetyl-CoA carboxylase alpha subunit
VPIITIIVGEGASGGALGIGGRSRLYAGEHLVFCNFQNLVLLFYGKAGNIRK